MATRSKARWLLRPVFAVAAALILAIIPPTRAPALSPDLRITQLYHTGWTLAEGGPTGVEALAQSSDGYLWLAAAGGLFRFDGIRFERIDGVGGERFLSSNIMTLFAPPDGGLWIGYRFGGASFIRDGKVTSYGASAGLPSGSTTGFAQDGAGVMWATTTWGLMRLRDGVWQDVREELNLASEYVKTLRVSRDGTLWIVIGHDVMSLRPGQSVFIPANIQTGDGDVSFVEASDGTLWLADERLGVRTVYAPGGSPSRSWISLRDARKETLYGRLIDRDGTLWTASASGIHRVKEVAHLLDPHGAATASRDTFSAVDGLTAPYAQAFLEDREGNVWIGTAGGLDRFRESRVTPVDLPRGADGYGIAAAADGKVFVVVDFVDSVFAVSPPSSVAVVNGMPHVQAAYRDADGVVWLGGRGILWHSSGPSTALNWTPVTLPIDRANADFYPVQAIGKDRLGRLWVSVVRGGIMRLETGGHWTQFGTDTSLSLATGADGRVWLGFPKNRIQMRDERDVVRDFSKDDGLDLGNVLAIHATAKDVWAGGELGLAHFDGGRFHAVLQRGGVPFPTVSGIATTVEGDLWLSTSEGAIRVAAQDAQRVAEHPGSPVRTELFDFLDGMPGTPNAMRPLPSVVAGTDGRIWFAGSKGIAWIDPQNVARNTLAPHVELQSVAVDGKSYEPQAGLKLPIRPHDVQISYTALSLSIPERVRFRYQLGAGEPWQDAGSRRTAYFTDLDPGEYTFRVSASNNDGVWNEAGAAIEFTIPPAFYQTRAFYVLCVLAGFAVLTVAYRVRVRQVAAQVRGRLEERLAERERIARDLHDTLLQGMQGLIWRFQAASDRIPPGEPARQLMEQSLDRADKLLEESRDKVKDLRPAASDAADLAQALAAEGEQFAELHSAKFAVSVQGAPRDLHPIVREEGFLIGREAMTNAFRHAAAATIEAEVTYGDGALHIRIRDDGRGIGEAVLEAGGRPGHFGLLGMRERAKKLGAHLEVWSKPGAGTEIDLRVPARVAYRQPQPESRGVRSWLGATS
jgi:signal transduction histidine kinase/ligand-binding sensor domain-containing protein